MFEIIANVFGDIARATASSHNPQFLSDRRQLRIVYFTHKRTNHFGSRFLPVDGFLLLTPEVEFGLNL